MKWAAVEIQWDGAPPLPSLMRVIASALLGLDYGYMLTVEGADLTIADLTDKGARFCWYKHGGRMPEIAPTIGYHWPCKVRWVEFGSYDGDRTEDEAWAALETTPWIQSRYHGTPDAFGRIGRHPGGGKAHGRRGQTQPARRAPVGVRRCARSRGQSSQSGPRRA